MDKDLLIANLRNIPDFPKPGIQFKDVSTLYKNAACLKEMIAELVKIYRDKGITKVVGIESRGFVLGAMLASELNAGFVMCRKPGKLPGETRQASYEKEYGVDTIEIHTDAIEEGDIVLIHDDLLATGGSMKAALELVNSFHPKQVFVNFLIELRMEGLKGREALGENTDLTTLLTLHE
ncbi:MAG: adenine phosphoribosyltransferase [Paludibacteraceae bacterium]|nr:adenine phosphoribosyltransferase [Paludibacteraceae bacterium]MBQ2268814.1 adenine phosphoribosyltransferase [Bacteroidaceae bacterium]